MGESMSGQEALIDGRCSGCKEVTRHIILSSQEEKPKQVECSQCHDQHRYKAPPPSKEERARVAAEKMRIKRQDEERERWAEMRPGMIEAKAKDYSMDGLFKKRDLISHPVFGLGLVEKKAGPRKIEVLFEDGCRVMRCQ